MAKEQFSKKDLEAVATDLNKIFEQPIPTGRKANIATLKKDLLEAAQEIQTDDNISDKSKEVLTALGAKLPVKEVPVDKKTPAKKGKIGVANPEIGKRNKLIESLITESKFTQKEIVAEVLKKFPDHSPSGIATMISDGKNEKYNKFNKLVKADPVSKILSF